jgi:radical SAM superfamily enzyme YgiQ (UPF0313 family)
MHRKEMEMTGDEARGEYAFETGIYRPPSEGGSYSLLIRVTRNCPWNKCTFCGMYKGERFEFRSTEEVKRDIDAIAAIGEELEAISRERSSGGLINRDAVIEMIRRHPELNTSHGFVMVLDWLQSGGRTAFLQDANSLIMDTDKLVDLLKYLRATFPSIERVTSYARSKTLARKSLEELREIREAGLDRLHVGLETGDDKLLKRIKKGASSQDHITGGKRAMEAGFQLSEYWMPGLGGSGMWESHAKETAQVLNEINPHYIRSRPFYPSPGTPIYEECMRGDWPLLSLCETLLELKTMIEALDVTSKVCFDHAGNHWTNRHGRLLFSQSYEGYKFPEKKPVVMDLIEEGIASC